MTERVGRDEARKELAQRELAKRDVIRFGQYMYSYFKPYPHQALIAEQLKQVVLYVETRGKEGCGRMLIETQPQVGKSLVASNLFPAWAMGNHPDWKFILTSFNDSRAQRNSKAVRDLVDSPKYRAVFGDLSSADAPVEISSDSRSAGAWSLAQPHLGAVLAAGVGGGITGQPANIILIDDPFKSREEAESLSRRDLVDDWFESQVYSRQQEGMAIILFHTRWNADDLAGRKIRAMVSNPRADKWSILCMPALALEETEYPANDEAQKALMNDGVFVPMKDPIGRNPGEALCPQMLSKETLESIRDNMSPYNWMSLYQQMPFVRSGGMFKRTWFQIADELPVDIKFTRSLWYWDQAATQGNGDYSAGALMAVDQFRRVWVLEVAHGQWSSFERRQEMKNSYLAAMKKFGTKLPTPQLWHQQDPASAGLDSARDTNVFLSGLPVHFEPVSGDKEVRADPWSSALESMNVQILKSRWNTGFINEHVLFPKGPNDDQVDAASSCYKRLTMKMEQQKAGSHQG